MAPFLPMAVALVDACVTEWRRRQLSYKAIVCIVVALVDACVTEWRMSACPIRPLCSLVALVDACVTEWPTSEPKLSVHSLFLQKKYFYDEFLLT